jgi:hypothetical protein
VGILTAIDALKMSITENFSLMGANTFSIQSRGNNYQVMGKRVRKRNFEHIFFSAGDGVSRALHFSGRGYHTDSYYRHSDGEKQRGTNKSQHLRVGRNRKYDDHQRGGN